MNSHNGLGPSPAGNTDCSDPTYRGNLGVEENWVGRTVVLAVSGDLDMLTAPKLAEAIQAVNRKELAALIVDLTRVEFLASAGMNVLINAQREVGPDAGFGVVADGPATSRPLNLIGIDTIIAVYRTLSDALDDFT